jgi:hypothetical protein
MVGELTLMIAKPTTPNSKTKEIRTPAVIRAALGAAFGACAKPVSLAV